MRALTLALLAMLLTGCDPFAHPESMFDEYHRRLARVLDVEAELTPLPTAPGFPRLRDRVREIEPIRIGMLDFFGLYGCELQFLVGERNSGLGRVAHPLTRLDYERRFIMAAEACLEMIEREGLAERLLEINALKRESLADAAWNAVWGSREIESHFTRARGPLPVGMARHRIHSSAENTRRLNHRLRALLDGELEQDLLALDPVFQRWLNDPAAGQALRSAILVAIRLDDASTVIEQRLGERPLCRNQRSNRQAEVMRSLFSAVYAAEIQPYLARVQQVRQALLPSLLALSQLVKPAPGESFERYVAEALDENSPHSLWQDFDRAVARHTRAWQALLEQCGMRPGGNGGSGRPTSLAARIDGAGQ